MERRLHAAGNPNCPAEDGPDVDFGAANILLDRGEAGSLLLAGQKSGDVYGIDADRQGAVLWRTKVGRGGIQGGVHFGMATDGVRLFVPISDMKDEHDGEVISEPSRAGLYALDPLNGKVLWSAPADGPVRGSRNLRSRYLCSDHRNSQRRPGRAHGRAPARL